MLLPVEAQPLLAILHPHFTQPKATRFAGTRRGTAGGGHGPGRHHVGGRRSAYCYSPPTSRAVRTVWE